MMKKLAFSYAGAFEMPTLRKVELEKESNIAYAVPNTIYKPNGGQGMTISGNRTQSIEYALAGANADALANSSGVNVGPVAD